MTYSANRKANVLRLTARGLSRLEIARLTGVSTSTISLWCRTANLKPVPFLSEAERLLLGVVQRQVAPTAFTVGLSLERVLSSVQVEEVAAGLVRRGLLYALDGEPWGIPLEGMRALLGAGYAQWERSTPEVRRVQLSAAEKPLERTP